MSIVNESIGASAVKVTAVATGAAMSGMQTVTAAVGDNGQHIIWLVTLAYGLLQIYKALPWATMQTIAIWRLVRHGDWSEFKRIARREQKTSDDGSL